MKNINIIRCVLVMLLGMSASIFGADPLYEKITELINESVVPWTRVIGILGLIGAICSFAYAKREQKDDLLKGSVYSLIIFFGVLLIPEIINWGLSENSQTNIDFN